MNREINNDYRELRYVVTEADVAGDAIAKSNVTASGVIAFGVTAGEIMRDVMRLSSREISRCKQFDDGVMKISANEGAIAEIGDLCKINSHEETQNEETKNELAAGMKGDLEKEAPVPMRLIDGLKPGDTLIVRLYEDNDNAGDIVPTHGKIEIVYEDEDLIVINKEGDQVVHPSYAHYTDSLSNLLAGYYEETGQRHVIRTVGRLDRETSGLVIFAKNRHSAALLSEQKENMSRRKEYLAFCSGVFEEKEGTVNAPIRRRPDERMIREVHPEGKEAITHYRVEKQFEDYALVRLQLDTGRTHQIRVHMAYLGHPLLGDNFYGKEIEDNKGLTRAALHAGYIEFLQPITGENVILTSELPEDMSSLA